MKTKTLVMTLTLVFVALAVLVLARKPRPEVGAIECRDSLPKSCKDPTYAGGDEKCTCWQCADGSIVCTNDNSTKLKLFEMEAAHRRGKVDFEKLSDSDRLRLTALHIINTNPLFDPNSYPTNANANDSADRPPRGNVNAGNANGALNRNMNMNSNMVRDKPDVDSKEPRVKP